MFSHQPDTSFVEMFRSLVENKSAGKCHLDEQIKYQDKGCQVVGIYSDTHILLGFKEKPDNTESFSNKWNKWSDKVYILSKQIKDFNYFYFIKSSDVVST